MLLLLIERISTTLVRTSQPESQSHTPEKAKALETLVNVSRGLFVCTFIHKLVKKFENKQNNQQKKKREKSNKILINTKKNVGKPKYQEIETQRENGEIRFEKRTENVTKHTAVDTNNSRPSPKNPSTYPIELKEADPKETITRDTCENVKIIMKCQCALQEISPDK